MAGVVLTLAAGAALASPATDRCDGDKACITAAKRGANVSSTQVDQTQRQIAVDQATAYLKTKIWGTPAMPTIVTSEEWDAFLATPEGQEMLEATIKRQRRAQDYNYANRGNVYSSTVTVDGKTSTCTTTFAGQDSYTRCN
jgi:hypothetical protein